MHMQWLRDTLTITVMEIIIVGVHSSRNVRPYGLQNQLYMQPPWKKHKLCIAFGLKYKVHVHCSTDGLKCLPGL